MSGFLKYYRQYRRRGVIAAARKSLDVLNNGFTNK